MPPSFVPPISIAGHRQVREDAICRDVAVPKCEKPGSTVEFAVWILNSARVNGCPPMPAHDHGRVPGMSRVAIEYCTQCRWLLRASWMAQELLTTFATDLSEVALIPGEGGVFRITVDGEQIWDRKADGGFPEIPVLKQRVRDRVAPDRSLGHSDKFGAGAAAARIDRLVQPVRIGANQQQPPPPQQLPPPDGTAGALGAPPPPPRLTVPNVVSNLTVSACPCGQSAGSDACAIGRDISKVSPQLRQRYA